MIRWGLCCQFIQEDIQFLTATATYLQKLIARGDDPLAYVDDIIHGNIASLQKAIDFCEVNGIFSFRITSDFMPVSTHPVCGYRLENLPDCDRIKKSLIKCGQKAKKVGIRLTFHPDQFVILSSPKEAVVEKSIVDLEYHATLADLLGADVINIHGGGGYGDKELALSRFEENFKRLPPNVKKRLTLENDDKVFTPKDLLPLCHRLKVPLVYDVHHHRCLPDGLTIEEATREAIATWDREPLFHLSSPLEGWKGPKPFRHHDYIDLDDFPKYWKTLGPLTIDVEAKAKELAVLRIKSQVGG